MNPVEEFERRKADHIRIALAPEAEAQGAGFDSIELVHEAIPEIDFSDVSIETEVFGEKSNSPLFVSSMTAGHAEGVELNLRLAQACAEKNWWMGVGSQRRQLFDQSAREEWQKIRKAVPDVKLLGNIGLSQLTQSSTDDIQALVDSLQAKAMIVHTNPIQEVFQPEGTPQFRGGYAAIEKLCKALSVPVIVKETGCGFSQKTLRRLNETGVSAIDVAGFGGTHWGRVEGYRSEKENLYYQTAQTFKNWGISTVDSVFSAVDLRPNYQVWASGGVRNGLDAAKLLAIGAEMVGLAKPIMQAALESKDAIVQRMDVLEYELKVALFCTGSKEISDLKEVWTKK